MRGLSRAVSVKIADLSTPRTPRACDPEQARIVELRFFAGSRLRTARVVGRSPRTVKREWGLAKAWLFRELRAERS
ncbi:MAG TPA: ECF-type sigma factor [Gemmatimonadaceae bacterium]|nr:ECF-type sigma factor [Gemmatimonadaceae bacterium]